MIAGDATKPPEDVLPALELALERDKRLAETGRATALLVDGLDLLPPEKAAEIFNAARNLAQGGSLTVACSRRSRLTARSTRQLDRRSRRRTQAQARQEVQLDREVAAASGRSGLLVVGDLAP